MATSEYDVVDAVRAVIDPDFGLSLVDLGLIRDVRLSDEGRHVAIDMTLTSPGCPIAPELMAAVDHHARKVAGVESVKVALVWSPPWDPRTDASDDARAELGIW